MNAYLVVSFGLLKHRLSHIFSIKIAALRNILHGRTFDISELLQVAFDVHLVHA